MEGVIDFAMREILTDLGGYDHAGKPRCFAFEHK